MPEIFTSGDFSKYAKNADLAAARGPIKDILDKAKEVARRIHEKYEDDKKEPTGNQNCLLCTWCAEAMLRGYDILPRPVYSPRDPALGITPEDMLKGSVEKRYFKNFSDMQNWYLNLKNARFYVHVKWSKGNGGHEFLLLNTNVPHVLDAQQGIFSPIVDLKTFKNYLCDIDYNETYICRIDNHDLDIENLKQINNESAIVAWDEDKDIQYMKEHNMLPESDSYTMRDATDSDIEFVYYSELKTVEENKNDPKVQRYIRKDAKESLGHTKIIVVDGKDAGVYQAYATNYYGVKEGKLDWWYLAHIYLKPEYRSKGIGSSIIKKDMSEHDKILLQVMKSNTKARKLYESLGFKFSQENDHGGIILRYEKKDEVVTESFEERKQMFHISRQSYLDGQVFKPRVPEYIDRYDPDDTGFENSTTPRVCVSPSIEGCFNAIVCKFIPSHPVPMDKMYVYTPEKSFREYKHKTNKELIRDKEVYDANLTKEAWILEPVRMRLYGVIQLDQVKKIKRKKTVPTNSGKSEQRAYFDIKYHWVIPPKVAKTSTAKYDPMTVCKNLASELAPYKYGLIKDGKLDTKASDSDYNKWRLSSPEEFEKAGGGNCYDFTEWEAGYLDAYGVKFNKYYISSTYKNKFATHSFIVVPNDGKFIYIERAFERVYNEIDGMKVFDKLDDIFKYILETMCEFENVPELNYIILEYSDATPKVGTPMKQFQEYIVTNGKEVSSGTIKARKD